MTIARLLALFLAVASLALLAPPTPALAQEEGSPPRRTGAKAHRRAARQRAKRPPEPPLQEARKLLDQAKGKPVRYRGDYRRLFRAGDRPYLGIAGHVEVSSETFTLRAKNVLMWIDPEEYDSLVGIGAPPAGGDIRREDETSGQEGPILPLEAIQAVYADEDVLFRQGEHVIRADRMFYDLVEEKALFVDASVRTFTLMRGRKMPLYLRADELRRVSPDVFTARNGYLSNSGFGLDVWHLRAREIDVSFPRGDDGEREGPVVIRARHALASAWGIPFFYLPSFSARGGGAGSRLYFRRARAGRSSQFGTYLFTEWGDDIALGSGKDRREIGEWTLHVDPMQARGIGLGLDLDYRSSSGFGRIRSYYVHDLADEDRRGRTLDPQNGEPVRRPVENPDRGRFRLQYRHFLPHGVEGTVEYSWLSDSNFLREYFEREFKQGKEQETLFHLKKVIGANAFTLLQRNRINDFLDEVETMPQAEHRLMVQPLVPGGLFGTNLYLSSRTRIGNLRKRSSNERQGLPATDLTRVTRFDTAQDLSLPVRLGPLTLRPFARGRYSVFSETRAGSGPTNRFSAAAGASLATQFHRVFRVRNRFLRIHDVRHIIHPYVAYLNRFSDTVPSEQLIPFDDVESLDEAEFFRFQIRNRFETKAKGKVHEFLNVDTAINVFPDEDRDNGGHTFGNLEIDLLAAPNRKLVFQFESEWNLHTTEFDVLNTGLLARPSRDLTLRLGYRVFRKKSASLQGQLYTRLNEKWGATLFERYNFRVNDTQDIGISLLRHTSQWIIELSVLRDEGDDDTRFSINLTPAALYRGSSRRGGVWDRELIYDLAPYDPYEPYDPYDTGDD